MLRKQQALAILTLSALGGGTLASADDLTLNWWTLDAGGEMWTTGGNFILSGTVGQPDADGVVMTGGRFTLTGGFWAVAARVPGDLNCDGVIDFDDINPFVLALSDPNGYYAAYPYCNVWNGDCNSDGVVDFDDINAFIALLSG
jgi:hypothetical protein